MGAKGEYQACMGRGSIKHAKAVGTSLGRGWLRRGVALRNAREPVQNDVEVAVHAAYRTRAQEVEFLDLLKRDLKTCMDWP